MMVHAIQDYIPIIVMSTLVLASVHFHFYRRRFTLSLLLLMLAGLALRFFMASLDPFLHDWDERFHALVAKNMMTEPFKPMLRVDPIMPYKMEDWCCNHIWVHKQPLFLWQMALSMTLFGVNELAVRIPSIIMGVVSIYFIYDMARIWAKNVDVAYLSALLFTVSFYHLELTSGGYLLDHNDVAFTFYVTASVWAFINYLKADHANKWALLVGLFVGCAVLNKWLTGILVFGGWGLYELLQNWKSLSAIRWKPLVLSVLTSLVVFLPWQLYILDRFPMESKLMYLHNRMHIFEVLGNHHGSIWFHFGQMKTMYGLLMLLFIPIGVRAILSNRPSDKSLSMALLAMVVVMYSFFSFLVKTKMPAFTYPVSAIIWIVIASGLFWSYGAMKRSFGSCVLMTFTILLAMYTLRPWKIARHRTPENQDRQAKNREYAALQKTRPH